GWLVEEVPNRASLDVLPPSGKGPSAELTQVEDRIVPAIYTRDLERRLDSIARNGGRVLRGRTPIGDGAKYGYYALFEDPHGNRICLYSEI
ncbi:MAG: VOC family protein, partial [Patescibacteria group bacterium]